MAVKKSSGRDPLHCFECWLEVENKIGARLHVFLLAGLETLSGITPPIAPMI
jgi:hypothetical protein